MSACGFSGNPNMYGLGIRVGFYLQWFGIILASWIARSQVPGMRFANSLFVAATFLALVIQTAKEMLRPVETYIVLLLIFGIYLYFVPVYIWRLLTCGNPLLNPSAFPRVHTGPVFDRLNFAMLVAIAIFQLWFWFRRVNPVSMDGCIEYGFFFGKLRLHNPGFVVANIVFLFLVLCCSAYLLFLSIRKWARRRLAEVDSEYGSESSRENLNVRQVL
jgi:hypothetical protein